MNVQRVMRKQLVNEGSTGGERVKGGLVTGET